MYDAYNTVEDHTYIPEQAFLYFPDGNSSKVQTDDFKTVYEKDIVKRMIFEGGIPYTQQQDEKINRFRRYLREKGIQLDERWTKPYVYKFLESAGEDYKRTIREIKAHTQYQDELRKKDFEELRKIAEPILRRGPFYTSGRDSKFRPLVVFDIKTIHEFKDDENGLKSALQYFLEFMYRNMLINGQVENFVGIIDIGFTSPFDLINTIKLTIGFLQNNYKYKMHAAYILKTTTMFQVGYSAAKQFMKEDTLRKVRVLKESDRITELLETCHPSQLEAKFGGTHPNIQPGDYWPPKMISSEYSNPKVSVNMASIDEYREKYKKEQLPGRKINKSFIVDDSEVYTDLPLLNKGRPSLKFIDGGKRSSIQINPPSEVKQRRRDRLIQKLKCCGCLRSPGKAERK